MSTTYACITHKNHIDYVGILMKLNADVLTIKSAVICLFDLIKLVPVKGCEGPQKCDIKGPNGSW